MTKYYHLVGTHHRDETKAIKFYMRGSSWAKGPAYAGESAVDMVPYSESAATRLTAQQALDALMAQRELDLKEGRWITNVTIVEAKEEIVRTQKVTATFSPQSDVAQIVFLFRDTNLVTTALNRVQGELMKVGYYENDYDLEVE